jgi:uncharacterized protein involved in tolerance to divalent cations
MARKQVRSAMVCKIKNLLDKWVSDEEIMARLKIPKTTYYRYKQQIQQEDKQLIAKTRTNELQQCIAEVNQSLDYCIKINKSICEHSKDDKARIEASAMTVKAEMGKLQLKINPPYSEQVRIISRDVSENTPSS